MKSFKSFLQPFFLLVIFSPVTALALSQEEAANIKVYERLSPWVVNIINTTAMAGTTPASPMTPIHQILCT